MKAMKCTFHEAHSIDCDTLASEERAKQGENSHHSRVKPSRVWRGSSARVGYLASSYLPRELQQYAGRTNLLQLAAITCTCMTRHIYCRQKANSRYKTSRHRGQRKAHLTPSSATCSSSQSTVAVDSRVIYQPNPSLCR